MARKTTAARGGFWRAPSLRRLALALLLAGLSAAGAAPASAADYFAGKSYGLAKCARAILHGYKVEHVKVHGHHFHCWPLWRLSGGWRTLILFHNQRLSQDDLIAFHFRVDSLNRYVADTLSESIQEGFGVPSNLPTLHFEGQPGLILPSYDDYVEKTRNLSRNQRREDWRTAAYDVLTVVVAELGNPLGRGTIRREADCDFPVFYEHDNFRGRHIRIRESMLDLKQIVVKGADMGDRISSICVPRGWQVAVYEDDHFRGDKHTFLGPIDFEDIERRNNLNWGDKISSIRVRRR